MQFILRWVRPSALAGITFGLRYVGKLSNGRKVYSSLPVTERDADHIKFAGGASAGNGSLGSGSVPGKIAWIWRGEDGKWHHSSHTFGRRRGTFELG